MRTMCKLDEAYEVAKKRQEEKDMFNFCLEQDVCPGCAQFGLNSEIGGKNDCSAKYLCGNCGFKHEE